MISEGAAGVEHGVDPLHHQFEDLDQQNETYVVGMWVFLVTEVMFFGAMFFAYVLYRWKFQATFWEAHQELNLQMGTFNTVVLLTSSLSMALAVHFAQLKRRKEQVLLLLATMALACTFLVVKFFEWKVKFEHGLVPGPNFVWHGHAPASQAQMFFSLYFAMTGLHALHVIIGVLVIGVLTLLTLRKHSLVESYIPNEMVGLYWHFVDVVWIFLFPLFYLIPV
jgi:cytochrome c oxidase subunit 3